MKAGDVVNVKDAGGERDAQVLAVHKDHAEVHFWWDEHDDEPVKFVELEPDELGFHRLTWRQPGL
jgi:hypothetical protein